MVCNLNREETTKKIQEGAPNKKSSQVIKRTRLKYRILQEKKESGPLRNARERSLDVRPRGQASRNQSQNNEVVSEAIDEDQSQENDEDEDDSDNESPDN